MRNLFIALVSALLVVCLANAAAHGQVTAIRDPLPPPLPPSVEAPAAVAVTVPYQELELAGQVLRTKLVEVRGTPEKVLAVLLDLGNGERQIVDLGSMMNFRATPIHTGDQIVVRGPRTTLGKANVLVATQVAANGDTITIRRVAPAVAATTAVVTPGYPVVNEVRRIDARIESLRSARLRDTRVEHMLADAVTRNGREVQVDLGPPSALWRANLKAGDWITIQGQDMNVNNRPVLLALEVSKDGTVYTIDRHLVKDEPAVAAVEPAVERVVIPVR